MPAPYPYLCVIELRGGGGGGGVWICEFTGGHVASGDSRQPD